MNPRVKKVTPLEDYKIEPTFTNSEVKIFDVAPYLNFGVFQELRDKSLFNAVEAWEGTVRWSHDQDFCPDTLYEESLPKKF